MSEFTGILEKKIKRSWSNNFGIENYDERRFGKYVAPETPPFDPVFTIKHFIKGILTGRRNRFDIGQIDWLRESLQGFQRIYDNLNDEGRALLVDLLAYRYLGYRRVKLKRNNKEYRDAIALGNSLADSKDTYNPHFLHFVLEKLDLNPIGYDIKLYFRGVGIASDFIIEQYAYKSGGKTLIEAERGDVVIDAGACWGDTALYFAHKVADKGKVYSFEFIPGNIQLFNINKSLNPHLAGQIELVEHPLSNRAGDQIYFKDYGPGSRIEFQPFEGQTGSTTTTTIDAVVKSKNIARVDFIKMDIEGAEPGALVG
ncbi:MAG TPA: FkbM family methyltransferase, partial [Cyclobacteriaceae bacterium]|nr:FkbM family methyltransferase [Cyclobacteriaceae bacterium]